ncbi:MAG: hypothetical protein ACYTBJ_22695 [Planctomycetota bacterium]|jgi:hypothetical protein
MNKAVLMISIAVTTLCLNKTVEAQALSICEVQYTSDVNGASPRHGSIVDCLGGIVIHKSRPPIRPRLTLYDPNSPHGWGGIIAKDLYSTGAFDDVNVGDWISFTNVEVEDFKGTTFLQYKAELDPNFTIISSANPLPQPLPVGIDEIAAPLEGPNQWVVADHRAEKYEAMLIKVIDVNVTDRGYGKAYDNYVLAGNTDPNLTCWASDYMNDDNIEIYHPYVLVGQNFCSVAGILEQYAAENDGISYDYYQLLTRYTQDFTIEQTADLDDDCDVDFIDFAAFAGHWLQQGCAEPLWCGGADINSSTAVDEFDLQRFSQNWLEGKLQ